jgi:hypothetical protein
MFRKRSELRLVLGISSSTDRCTIAMGNRAAPSRSPTFAIILLAWLIGLVGATPSLAVEVFRNRVPYEIAVELPSGHSFYADALDRKFIIGDIAGIFRLIQDNYLGCDELVEERISNRMKDGFTRITRKSVSEGDCAISIANDDRDLVAASFYIWLNRCSCYSATHFYYRSADRPEYLTIVQPILDSIRANNN